MPSKLKNWLIDQSRLRTVWRTQLRTLLHTKWGRLMVGCVSTVTILLLLVWGAAPALLKWQLTRLVFERSAHTLKIEQLQINPLSGKVHVGALSLKTPENELLVGFSQLDVDWSWGALLTGQLGFDSIDLNGLDGRLVLLPNGQLNWSPLLLAFSKDSQEKDEKMPNLRIDHLVVRGAHWGLIDRRVAHGFETAFSNIDVDLNHLSTQANQQGEFDVQAQTAWGAHFSVKGQVQLQQLAASAHVAVKGVDLARVVPMVASYVKLPDLKGHVEVGAEVAVSLPQGQLQAQVSQAHVRLEKGLYRAQSTSLSTVALEAFDAQGGEFQWPQNTFQVAQAQLKGLVFDHRVKADAKPTRLVQLDQLSVNDIQGDLSAHQVRVQQVGLTGGSFQVHRDAQGRLDLMQAVEQLMVTQGANGSQSEQNGRVAWKWGVQNIALSALQAQYEDRAFAGEPLNAGFRNGTLSVQQLSSDFSKPLPIQAALHMVSGGRLAVEGSVVPASSKLDLNVTSEALALPFIQPILSSKVRLQLVDGLLNTRSRIQIQPNVVDVKGKIDVKNLRLDDLGGKHHFLSFDQLSVPAFQMNANRGLDVPRVELSGLKAALLIAKDRSTNLSQLMISNSTESSKPSRSDKSHKSAHVSKSGKLTNSSQSDASQFPIRVGVLSLSRGQVQFEDLSLVLPFGAKIDDFSGTLSGLSNRSNHRSQLNVKGRVNRYGEMQAKGQLDVFNPMDFMKVGVKFHNIEMLDLTPYSATFANRKIRSGKLSLDLDYGIQAGKLNSTNRIVMDQLELGDKVKSPSGMDLPLDLALTLLADSQGRIDLGIPVYGDLNDPQFSVGQVVWKAVVNVLTKAVTAPFRALAGLLGSHDENSAGQVLFEAGQAVLMPAQQEVVDQLAGVLKQKENLKLTINGTWSELDRVQLMQQQLKQSVLQKTSKKSANTLSLQEPLDVENQLVQDALQALFIQRLGQAEWQGFRKAFEQANPKATPQPIRWNGFGGLLTTPRVFSDQEIQALKGVEFYPELLRRLEKTESVPDSRLTKLAQERAQMVAQSLKKQGISEARMEQGEVLQASPTEEQVDHTQVPLQLGIVLK